MDDDIIRMAREAGLTAVKLSKALGEVRNAQIERFAALVAAAEREACAQLAECYDLGTPDGHDIAKYIRARSKA